MNKLGHEYVYFFQKGTSGQEMVEATGIGVNDILQFNPELSIVLFSERRHALHQRSGQVTEKGIDRRLVDHHLIYMPPGRGKKYEYIGVGDITNTLQGTDQDKVQLDAALCTMMTHVEEYFATKATKMKIPLMLRSWQTAANQAGVFESLPSDEGKIVDNRKGESMMKLFHRPIDWSKIVANNSDTNLTWLVEVGKRHDIMTLKGVDYPTSGEYFHQRRARGRTQITNQQNTVQNHSSDSLPEKTFSRRGAPLPLIISPTHETVDMSYTPKPDTRVELNMCTQPGWLSLLPGNLQYYMTSQGDDGKLYVPEHELSSTLCAEVGWFTHLLFRGIDLYLVMLHKERHLRKIRFVFTEDIPASENLQVTDIRAMRPPPEVYPPLINPVVFADAPRSMSTNKRKPSSSSAGPLDKKARTDKVLASGGGPSSFVPRSEHQSPTQTESQKKSFDLNLEEIFCSDQQNNGSPTLSVTFEQEMEQEIEAQIRGT